MRRHFWKKGLSALLGMILSVQTPLGALTPSVTSFAYTERSATINASSLNVRSGAGTGYSSVTKLAKGTAVSVINETTGTDGKLWYQIRFTGNGGAATTGYVLNTYIRFPVAYSADSNFESQLAAQGFPESYKDGLRQLHAQYPNWIFEAQQTGLDWNSVIENEMVLPRSLVDKNSISSYKSLQDGAYNWDTGTWVGFDGSTWVAASQEILSYYMDPRNALDQVSIFQFLSHKYDPNVQTRDNLQSMVKGTFLEKPVIWKGSGTAGTGNSGFSDTASSIKGGGPGVSSSSGGPGVVGGSNPTGTGMAPVSSGVQSSGGQTSSGQSSGVSSNAPTLDNSTLKVELKGPMASISKSKKDLPLLAETVIIGARPGDDSSGGSAQSSGSVQLPASNTGISASQAPAVNQSASPAVVENGNSSANNVGNSQQERTYVDIIMDAAQSSGVNPYVIAAMILQEQGKNASGRSISGTVSGYSGFYNYFNVGAYATDGLSAVERGLWYASQSGTYGRPWNTPERSIIGGAGFYGQNYVNAGQDTFYLKKYNVQGNNIYKHQYMTNVDGAAAEASLFAEAYNDNLRHSALRFKIPVYNNMPAIPCAKPTGSGSPNNKLKSLYVDGFQMTPAFSRDVEEYQVTVDQSVMNVNINALAYDNNASISGGGNVQTINGMNEIMVRVTAQNGNIRDYKLRIIKQTGGPTYNSSMSVPMGSSSSGSAAAAGAASGTVSSGGPGVNAGGPGVSAGGISAGSTSAGLSASGGVMTGGSQSAPGGSQVTVIQ